jgi:hypothetical protein
LSWRFARHLASHPRLRCPSDISDLHLGWADSTSTYSREVNACDTGSEALPRRLRRAHQPRVLLSPVRAPERLNEGVAERAGAGVVPRPMDLPAMRRTCGPRRPHPPGSVRGNRRSGELAGVVRRLQPLQGRRLTPDTLECHRAPRHARRKLVEQQIPSREPCPRWTREPQTRLVPSLDRANWGSARAAERANPPRRPDVAIWHHAVLPGAGGAGLQPRKSV